MSTPPSQPTMGEKKDILDDLLEAIEANGSIERSERDRLLFLAFTEVIRRVRKMDDNSLVSIFKRKPVQAIAVTVLVFTLLHEFSTYVNISVIINAALKALGIPMG